MSYDIYSITKAMTAAAILKLVSEGRVGLEATAATYIPALEGDKREITILHLLLHASGLPESFGLDEVYVSRDTLIEKVNRSQLLSLIQTPMRFRRTETSSGWSPKLLRFCICWRPKPGKQSAKKRF